MEEDCWPRWFAPLVTGDTRHRIRKITVRWAVGASRVLPVRISIRHLFPYDVRPVLS